MDFFFFMLCLAIRRLPPLNFIGGGVMIWAVDIVDNYDKYMVVRSQLCKRIFFSHIKEQAYVG